MFQRKEGLIRVVLFSFGARGDGGNAVVQIYGPPPASALDDWPYYSCDVGFGIKAGPPDADGVSRIARSFMDAAGTHVLFIFSGGTPHGLIEFDTRPYREQISNMLLGMLKCCTLENLSAIPPTILPPGMR